MKMVKRILCLLLTAGMLWGCGAAPQKEESGRFSAGFGCVTLELPAEPETPLYIAGYHSGREITGSLDAQQARALWLDDGAASVLLIAVDCVGLSRTTVQKIRAELEDFCRKTGCDSVNVISTHTHAGVDTLGLWGPVAMDGKNEAFMQTLVSGAVRAAEMAYADRSQGTLTYTVTPTSGLQADSREPQVFDNQLYQLRFVPEDAAYNGIRLVSFAAHAESLRGSNTLVSRDYPGVLCDTIRAETGEDALFVPGAIGGLILTPELTQGEFDPVENLTLTGQRLAAFALQTPAYSRQLQPKISLSTVDFEVELDNTLFIYYQFLGVLQADVRRSISGQYFMTTELTVLQLDGLALALLPGEICPELVEGTKNPQDPLALRQIAQDSGVEDLVIIGLANDEIGYILPPSDFVLDPTLPYFREAEGDHYEETNSTGAACAEQLAEAFRKALK